MERVIGLALVLLSMMLSYGLTLPQAQGHEFGTVITCIAAVCGAFFGMPLLVTGQLRQKR